MAQGIARWSLIALLFVAPAALAQTESPTPPPTAMPQGQPPPPMQPEPRGGAGAGIRAACGMDIQRLCSGVPRGGGRIVECLVARSAELSPPCRAEIASVRGGAVATAPPPGMAAPPAAMAPPPRAGMAPPPAGMSPPPAGMAPPPANNRAAFQASCGSDARAFCPGVSKEEVARCLGSHRAELSPACKAYMQQMRAERGAQRSNPPPAATDMALPPPLPARTPPPAANPPPNE